MAARGLSAVRFAGLILAGGQGRRWGAPKAWVRLPDGRSFLEAGRDLLRAAGGSPVVATLPPGSPGASLTGVRGVPLPEPDLDMFSSLKIGLAALVENREWRKVVVLPVDHPLVAPATVVALVAPRAGAAIPAFAGRHGHPVCLERSVAEGVVAGSVAGPTMREVLRAAGTVDVPVDDPGVRANCNTPAALEEALELVASAGAGHTCFDDSGPC